MLWKPCSISRGVDISWLFCSGKVTPDGALLLASLIYIAVLCLACLLPSPALRCIVAASSAITVAYTPILKRITLVKNLAVAFIIAASPLSGALAAAVCSCPFPQTIAQASNRVAKGPSAI